MKPRGTTFQSLRLSGDSGSDHDWARPRRLNALRPFLGIRAHQRSPLGGRTGPRPQNEPKRGRPPLAQPSSDVVHHGARRSGELEVLCAACRRTTLMESSTSVSLRCRCAPRRVIRSECSCSRGRMLHAWRARDAYKNGGRCGQNLTALDLSSISFLRIPTHQPRCSPALPSLSLLSPPLPLLAEVR